MTKERDLFERRARRTRHRLRKFGQGRPRLSVFRSSKHIYAQVIDDLKGVTIAAASTSEEAAIKEINSKGWNKAAAAVVGKLVAERAIAAGATDVVFDRGGYIFHGRVKALADAAREAGLKF